MEARPVQRGIGNLIAKNRILISFVVGYALCRTCTELPLALPSFDYAAQEVGKLAGIAGILVVGYSINRDRSKSWLPYVPSALMVLGVVSVLLGAAVPALGGVTAFATASSVMLGAGAAACMIQWLEYCGTLPSKKIVAAIAATYILDSLAILALDPCGVVPRLATLACAAALSTVLAVMCRRDPSSKKTLAGHVRSIDGDLRDTLPLDVILWVLIVSSTFGIMEGSESGAIMGTLTDSIGRMIPCAIVLCAYFFAADRFDMRYVYAMTLPLLVAALSFAGYGDGSQSLAQLFFCMGAAVSRLIVYLVVCVRAYQHKVSSLFGCGAIMFINVLMHNTTVALSGTAPFVENRGVLLIAAVIVDSTIIVLLLIHELDRLGSIDGLPGVLETPSEPDVARAASDVAQQHGLSPRETTVFTLMVSGLTNVEISDRLFISHGAVRSHVSRIYEKLGVHTRQDFDEKVAELVG